MAVLVVSFAGVWRSVTDCAAEEAPERSTTQPALPADNPFAVPSPLPFHAPAFDKIRVEHFLPTFTFGMKQQLAEMNAAFLHALEIKPRVLLLILERLQHAFAEGGGRLGKPQQHQRHQFGGEQFMIREKMQQPAAFA